jgi:hypothetical protein
MDRAKANAAFGETLSDRQFGDYRFAFIMQGESSEVSEQEIEEAEEAYQAIFREKIADPDLEIDIADIRNAINGWAREKPDKE